MRRNLRAIALAVTAGLLLVAPSATALATTPIPIPRPLQAERVPLSTQLLAFRQHKGEQSLADGLQARSGSAIDLQPTTTIDLSSRFDGKRVPI